MKVERQSQDPAPGSPVPPHTWRNTFGVATMASLLTLAPVHAAESIDTGIGVTGVGRAEAPPDTLVLSGTLSTGASLTADAMVKYRDAKRRIDEALTALKIEGLSLNWSGMVVNSSSKTVTLTDSLSAVVSGIDKLAPEDLEQLLVRLMDGASDSGLTLADSNRSRVSVDFKIADTKALEAEAYKKAMDDAKANAARLARLAGVRLGSVVSIQSTPVAQPSTRSVSTSSSSFQQRLRLIVNRAAVQQDAEIATGETQAGLGLVPITVNLRVQFEIQR